MQRLSNRLAPSTEKADVKSLRGSRVNDNIRAAKDARSAPAAAVQAPASFASLLTVGNPFSGNQSGSQVANTVAKTVASIPALPIPPISALTAQGVPDSIRLDAPSSGAVSFNSARSVAQTNAAYNREAVESYQYQVQNWRDNNGRRWLNGQFVKTEIPPPPPVLKETSFDKILARMESGQPDITPIPYYMGNKLAGQIYEYNSPLDYTDGNTTTYEVAVTGERIGTAIATPQGQQFAPNITQGVTRRVTS